MAKRNKGEYQTRPRRKNKRAIAAKAGWLKRKQAATQLDPIVIDCPASVSQEDINIPSTSFIPTEMSTDSSSVSEQMATLLSDTDTYYGGSSSSSVFVNLDNIEITRPDWCKNKYKATKISKEIEITPHGAISSDEYDGIMQHQLTVEKEPHTNAISGNRIVEIDYFVSMLLKVQYAHNMVCTLGKYQIKEEIRRGLGLVSCIVLECTSCEQIQKIFTENPIHKESIINNGAVWGTLATGSTYTHFTEQISCMDIPKMPNSMFLEFENNLGTEWRKSLWKSMELAGIEENKNAMEVGNVSPDGIPWITVYLDGSWSKRSYGHAYDALSGMVGIIGKVTGELLFIGVRNRFCSICCRAENKNEEAKAHTCYKNWDKSAPAIESDIVVDGFCCSEEMHGVRYLKFVADGDASTFAHIQEKVPYGHLVKKIECTNHALKNYSKHLHKMKKDTHINIAARKMLSMHALKHLIKRAKTSIYEHAKTSTRNVNLLKEDLINGIPHVFGEHTKCRDGICNTIGDITNNKMPELRSTTMYHHIIGAVNLLVRKAHLLIDNENNNRAERLMNIVARFNMGKRLNLVQRGSYERRTHLAGLRHNKKFNWHSSPWKKIIGKSPGQHFKKFMTEQAGKSEKNIKAKKRLYANDGEKQPQKRPKTYKNVDYGTNAEQPMETEEFYMAERRRILNDLKVNENEILNIAMETVGQFDNDKYVTYKKNRMTASVFADVIKRRPSTPCHNTVVKCLGKRPFSSKATDYGIAKESVAIKIFQEKTGLKVEPSGLWIHEEYNYLGASPDEKNLCISYEENEETGSSQGTRNPIRLARGTSIAGVADTVDRTSHSKSFDDILDNSGALSLPFLHNINAHLESHLDNVDVSQDHSSSHKYRRRPRTVNYCEDDKTRPYQSGSFRSAGSGCAKLKRNNACRQKIRTVGSSPPDSYHLNDAVRSRSLNHLDNLEMRQGTQVPADTALKDARSEPDCTRPLLAPGPVIVEKTSPSRAEPLHRRHMLSRSQKSSSECFSVNFEVGDEATYDTELFFPASRGITLNESLNKLCDLRNIDLSSCDAWLSDKDGTPPSWLSFSQDTACLVGKHIRISTKDNSNKNKSTGSFYGTHSRKLSGNFRPRTSTYFSSSTEDASTTSISTNWSQPESRLSAQDFDYKKQPKQRWSGLFGTSKDSKQLMELLIEQLSNYSKFGVPISQTYQLSYSESTDALSKLENNWTDIIDDTELTERQQKQQTALWELIKTEVAYIKTLKVVTDLFLSCLINLQSTNLLKEIDTIKLFSNINDILEANILFWETSLYPLVKSMRCYKQPPCIETMCEGFLKIKDSFHAYYRFCGEQARCQHYCRENLAHNDLFTAYLAWCETQKDCNRLRLMDILVQPMQRLTKYGLLLKAILKNTDDEVERDNLNLMIKSVDDFVNNVNSSLKQKQDNERLKGIIARIESYDIVETKDDDLEKLLKSYNQLDLNKPMLDCPPDRKRHLLLEGDLKLKDSNTSKMEVHCFLLTDMLLVCKPSTKKGGQTMRVIRQPYLVDRLVVTELNKETPTLACVYKNEFDMAVAAFIIQNTDGAKLKSWKDGIKKAQTLYSQAKQFYVTDESLDIDYSFEFALENDMMNLQLAPRSPLASSSRASRVSSLAHSHSGSVEMNDQSSIGSAKEAASRAISVEADNRTGSISSDEGVQSLPPDKSPGSQKNSFKHRLFNKTPNTLSVQPYSHGLGQSLPNLALPNAGSLNLNLNQNTLSVPSTTKGGHLLSPTHRGISYPPPSPTRANLRRGLAISQNKNPPLIKTRHVVSTNSSSAIGPAAASFDFVPVIAGASKSELPEQYEFFNRGQHRHAMMKRVYRNDNKRYHTAGMVDEIKRNEAKDASIYKRMSWTCSSEEPQTQPEDQT